MIRVREHMRWRGLEAERKEGGDNMRWKGIGGR